MGLKIIGGRGRTQILLDGRDITKDLGRQPSVEIEALLYRHSDSMRKLGDIIDSVILFGSVAEGRSGETSDVDLYFMLKQGVDEHNVRGRILKVTAPLEKKLSRGMGRDINISALIRAPKDLDAYTLNEIIRKGKMVYGTPYVRSEDLSLDKYKLISYSLKELDQNTKTKVMRKLYGGKSSYTYKGKKRKTRVRGVVERVRADKLSTSTLLVKDELAGQIMDVLKTYKVDYHEYDVWMQKA